MTDYIDREAALDCFKCDLGKKDYKISYQGAMIEAAFRINDIPAADVRENKRGRWIMNDECKTVCSLCGNVVAFVSYPDRRWEFGNFCPNCGAQMDIREAGE